MREIPGFTGYYCDKNGDIFSLRPKHYGKIYKMKKRVNRLGYERICLMKDRIHIHLLVHRLILKAFIGEDKVRKFCNHINGIKNDNRLSNLEWVTCLENERHSIEILGKNMKGENHPAHKLTEEKVKLIRKLRSNGNSYQSIANKFSIGPSTCARICNREKWTHV